MVDCFERPLVLLEEALEIAPFAVRKEAVHEALELAIEIYGERGRTAELERSRKWLAGLDEG